MLRVRRPPVEIRRRIGTAKSTTSKLANVWKASEISIKTKVRLAKALVWSVALSGCESWTLN